MATINSEVIQRFCDLSGQAKAVGLEDLKVLELEGIVRFRRLSLREVLQQREPKLFEDVDDGFVPTESYVDFDAKLTGLRSLEDFCELQKKLYEKEKCKWRARYRILHDDGLSRKIWLIEHETGRCVTPTINVKYGVFEYPLEQGKGSVSVRLDNESVNQFEQYLDNIIRMRGLKL